MSWNLNPAPLAAGRSTPPPFLAAFATFAILLGLLGGQVANATTPAAPSSLSVTAVSATQVSLSWTNNANNATGIHVSKINNWSSFTVLDTLGAGATSDTLNGLTPSTTYYLTVSAYNNTDGDSYSMYVTVVTPIAAPAAPVLTGTVNSQSQITLSWTTPSGPIGSYSLSKKTGNGAFGLLTSPAAGVNSYADTGLLINTPYSYEITATNAGGTSPVSNIVQLTILPPPPATPTGFSVTQSFETELDLAWSNPQDATITGYSLQREDANGHPIGTPFPCPGFTYNDTGLTVNTTYNYALTAINSGGPSGAAPATGTTLPLPPPTPTALTATVISQTTVNLSWTGDNTGNTLTYQVSRQTAGGVAGPLGPPTTGTTYSDSTCTANTQYTYTVVGTNREGSSGPSNPATVTTWPNLPSAPANFTAVGVAAGEIDLSWTATTDTSVTGYILSLLDPVSGHYNQIATPGPGDISYKATGLLPVTSYTYQLYAQNIAGNGPPATATASTPTKVWDTGDPIDGDSIDAPSVVSPGDMVDVSVDSASDTDHWIQGTTEGTEDDTLTYSWSSSAGTFIASTTDSAVTWQAPTAAGPVTLTCVVDDEPTPIVAPDVGTRDDAAVTDTASIDVEPKVWDVGDPVDGGSITAPATITPGESAIVSLDGASDTDHWVQGATGGSEDDVLTYQWSCPAGGGDFIGSSTDSMATWQAPATTGPITITCTVDDEPTPVVAPDTGTRDDAPVAITASIDVETQGGGGAGTGKAWDPGLPIGEHYDTDGVTILYDEQMTSPQDQTQTPATPATVVALLGASLSCAIQNATDLDHWTQGQTEGTASDTVKYTWTCTAGGFQVTPPPPAGKALPRVIYAQTGTWVAPAKAGAVTLSCTISNPPSAINAPDTGNRMDASVVRTVTVQVTAPTITFSGLTNNTVRACAGAVSPTNTTTAVTTPDGVHTAAVGFTATLNGQVQANQPFTLSFDDHDANGKPIDYTGCTPPQFIDSQGHKVSTLAVTTDVNGNASVTVLSSDLISQPSLVVTWNGLKVAGVWCDFAAVRAIRRYGIKDLDQGYATDNGWDFEQDVLQNPGDTTTATLFLKFQRDTNKVNHPIDQNYFVVTPPGSTTRVPGPDLDADRDGEISDQEYATADVRNEAATDSLHRLTDTGNWLAVPNHQIRVKMSNIVLNNGTEVASTDFPQYVVFVDSGGFLINDAGNEILDPNNQPVKSPDSLQNYVPPTSIPITTDSNGQAIVHVMAADLIPLCQHIDLDCIDLTQQADDGVVVNGPSF